MIKTYTYFDKSKWKHGGDTSMAQDAYFVRAPCLILGFRGFNCPRDLEIHVSFWILELPM